MGGGYDPRIPHYQAAWPITLAQRARAAGENRPATRELGSYTWQVRSSLLASRGRGSPGPPFRHVQCVATGGGTGIAPKILLSP
jgi:hypothetical protein